MNILAHLVLIAGFYLQIWTVAANVLSTQPQATNKVQSSNFGIGRRAVERYRKRLAGYEVVQGLGLADAYENGNGAWGLMRFRVLPEQLRKY
jgi:hypothetical protein